MQGVHATEGLPPKMCAESILFASPDTTCGEGGVRGMSLHGQCPGVGAIICGCVCAGCAGRMEVFAVRGPVLLLMLG